MASAICGTIGITIGGTKSAFYHTFDFDPRITIEFFMLAILPILLAVATAVIDGDTVTIEGDRIRIANIDTPEIHHAKCDAERRLGLVAKARVIQILASGEVIVHPGDPGTGRTTDRYGRTLATISVDGRDLGDMLISENLARPWEGKRRSWCD